MCLSSQRRIFNAMFNSIAGIPAHPMFVHFAVSIAPIAAILALLWITFPRWRTVLGPSAVGFALLSVPSVFFARISGEALLVAKGLSEENLGPVKKHALYANLYTVSTLALVVAVIVLFFLLRRCAKSSNAALSRGLCVAVSALTALCAVAVLTTTVLTGHEGARLTWSEEGNEAGETGEAMPSSSN